MSWKWMGVLGILGSLVLPAHAVRTLNWAGLDWECKSGYQGPGPNNFSDSTNNIWVDGNGDLHLKVTRVGDQWYCAEIISEDFFHFGEYRFQIASDITLLDTNLVGGLFNYRHTGALTPPIEIDIEFARQFIAMTTNENTQYGIQFTPGNGGPWTNAYYFYTPNETETTHLFYWTNSHTYFQSYTGHGDPGTGDLIAEYTRSSDPAPYPSIPARLHLNLWMFQSRPPTDTQHVELVIRDCFTPPAEPEIVKPVITNILEDFEDGLSVLPESSTNLWTFETGTREGFERWSWQHWMSVHTEFYADSASKHSGTYSLRLGVLSDEEEIRYSGISNATPIVDWSAYTYISYWAKGDAYYLEDGQPYRMKVKITEQSGESWEQSVGMPVTNTWQQAKVYFGQMAWAGGGSEPHILDLSQIARVDFYVDDLQAAGYMSPWYVTYYNIDDVSLGSGGNTNFDWTLGWWNNAYATMCFQTNVLYSGTNALEIRQIMDIESPTWLCAWTTNLLYRDWSTYSKISFWAKRSASESDGVILTNHLVKFQFIEMDGDMWEQKGMYGDDPLPNAVSTNWTRYELSLSRTSFDRGGSDWTNGAGSPPGNPPYSPGNEDISDLQRTNVYALRIVFRNPWTNRVTYYVDDIEIFHSGGSQVVSLAVSPGQVGFGAMMPEVNEHRFVSTNYVVVDYQIENIDPYAYWSIIAYTTNEGRQIGIPGTFKTNMYLPLRSWVGVGEMTPPTPQTNWTTHWSFINDQGATPWPMADTANPVPSGFKLYFAAEAMGAYTQDYRGNVTLELKLD